MCIGGLGLCIYKTEDIINVVFVSHNPFCDVLLNCDHRRFSFLLYKPYTKNRLKKCEQKFISLQPMILQSKMRHFCKWYF